jgi:PadR family transcriptional regulator, regulatory protein PadR
LLASAATQEREEPQRHRARHIFGRLGVDSRHQDFVVSTVYLHHGANTRFAARHARSADPAHAAEGCPARLGVSERIQQISQDVLQINQGSLYPALHRLEHQGWIEAEWKVSELGRRAKYYQLTASGRRQLAVEAREWERMANAIGRVLKLA